MPGANKVDAFFASDALGRFAGFACEKGIAAEGDRVQQVMIAAAGDHAKAAHGLRSIRVDAWGRARDLSDSLNQVAQCCAFGRAADRADGPAAENTQVDPFRLESQLFE